MDKLAFTFLLGLVLIKIIVVIFFVTGWILSIVHFVQCDFNMPLKCEAINGIGVFVPPVGGIVGWLDIVD